MVQFNKIEYGLSQEYIDYLKLPKGCDVKVFDINKIIKARKRFMVTEKI